MEKIILYLHKWHHLIINHAETIAYPYVIFGIFGVVNYPISYVIWHYTSPMSYTSVSLGLIATGLCLLLVFKQYWPKKLLPYLPLYWYVTLLYCLPFFFTFFLLKNDFAQIWVFYSLAAMIISIFLLDLIPLLIVVPLGILLGYLAFTSTTSLPILFPPYMPNYIGIVIIFISIIIFGALFAYRKDRLQKEKIRTMKMIGASIAHELRTPLLSIRAGVSGIKEFFPQLIGVYQLAKSARLPIPEVQSRHFEVLLTALDDIEAETHFANTVINMLLVKITPSNLRLSEFEMCSVANCIDEAIRRYPFISSEQTALVQWKGQQDFLFKGIKLFMIHILFNLLKNALYYIEAAGKGEISIWVVCGDKYNRLHFKDTGQGISAKILPRIFERFFSRTHNGAGLGLTFCKMVMKSFGGDILCFSKEGEYTEFVLEFPMIKINPAS